MSKEEIHFPFQAGGIEDSGGVVHRTDVTGDVVVPMG